MILAKRQPLPKPPFFRCTPRSMCNLGIPKRVDLNELINKTAIWNTNNWVSPTLCCSFHTKVLGISPLAKIRQEYRQLSPVRSKSFHLNVDFIIAQVVFRLFILRQLLFVNYVIISKLGCRLQGVPQTTYLFHANKKRNALLILYV